MTEYICTTSSKSFQGPLNADKFETALFWQMLSNKIKSEEQCMPWTKLSVLLAANMDGSYKLRSFVIANCILGFRKQPNRIRPLPQLRWILTLQFEYNKTTARHIDTSWKDPPIAAAARKTYPCAIRGFALKAFH